MRCGKTITAGDFRIAGIASAKAHAFGKQIGPGGTMDCAVDASTTEQRVVGGVDDRIDLEGRDIGEDGIKRGHRQPSVRRSPTGGGATGTRPRFGL
jgi:hypothetical protein